MSGVTTVSSNSFWRRPQRCVPTPHLGLTEFRTSWCLSQGDKERERTCVPSVFFCSRGGGVRQGECVCVGGGEEL